jgi:very-short-patch-repair endonuclease
MRKPTSTILDRHARRMRRAMTEPEKRLWWHLRHRLPLERTHFRRQVVIGTAIVDFARVTNKLIVEVDGSQHGDDDALAYDTLRASTLERDGWRLLRFWNHQVMTDMDNVIETIMAAIDGRL